MYGSNCWALNTSDQIKMEVVKIRMLREIRENVELTGNGEG